MQPLHTKIEKSIRTMMGLVVLEDPINFPRDESNLYCCTETGKVVWQAEKPEPNGLYSRLMMNTDGQTLSAYAVTGQACELDLRTGKLLSQTVIK
jgi:hypothetical protein